MGCVAAYADGIYVLVMDDCRLTAWICSAVRLCWLCGMQLCGCIGVMLCCYVGYVICEDQPLMMTLIDINRSVVRGGNVDAVDILSRWSISSVTIFVTAL